MSFRPKSFLNPKKRYLQVALNSTLEEARKIIEKLPPSDRILVEAGTPVIKRYGEAGISQIYSWWQRRISGQVTHPYVVADLKTMDRGETEVQIASNGGASAAIALGSAPVETLNAFIDSCETYGIDPMIDMMNIDYPLSVLRALKKIPPVVILHRGVDEERFNREKQIPFHEIHRIKGNYNIMISIAGGDSIREVQRAVFNDADVVVAWKSFYQSAADTGLLAEKFLKEIK